LPSHLLHLGGDQLAPAVEPSGPSPRQRYVNGVPSEWSVMRACVVSEGVGKGPAVRMASSGFNRAQNGCEAHAYVLASRAARRAGLLAAIAIYGKPR
jgi:hypothetical protein